jgi:hypothetical protein
LLAGAVHGVYGDTSAGHDADPGTVSDPGKDPDMYPDMDPAADPVPDMPAEAAAGELTEAGNGACAGGVTLDIPVAVSSSANGVIAFIISSPCPFLASPAGCDAISVSTIEYGGRR